MGVMAAAGPRRQAALSTFFGRDKELSDLRSLLVNERLLTITGIGGAGKTRLATAVRERALDSFPDGTWVAELALIEKPELVDATIADAVRAARDDGAADLDRAGSALRTGRQLLVLDNCEHVIDAGATACSELLRDC